MKPVRLFFSRPGPSFIRAPLTADAALCLIEASKIAIILLSRR